MGRNAKALAILTYLLAYRARQVSQDHLMGWLWPESNLKKARWSPNSAIHILRRILSSCSPSTTVNYILLEEGYYRLCPTVEVTTDIDEFDVHYEQGRCLEKANRTEEAAEYEKAVEIYQGDYLVEDLYEDWTMVERERLANAYVDMLGRLTTHYMESEQPQEAIRTCYKLLEKDRCHEDSYPPSDALLREPGAAEQVVAPLAVVRRGARAGVRHSRSSETRALYTSLLGDEGAEARSA